jgi:hypothetical protein
MLYVTEADTQVLLVEDEYEEHYMTTLLDLNQSKLSVIEECYTEQFIEEEQNLRGHDLRVFIEH